VEGTSEVMKISLNLIVHTCGNLGPNFRIWVNKEEKYSTLNQLENLKLEIEVEKFNTVNTLMIEHYGKNPIGLVSDIAVEILEISFDGLILPRNMMYDQVFYPNWTWSDAPNFLFDNCYLGYNGVWHMSFSKDVRAWILDYLEKEMFGSSTPAIDTTTSKSFDLDNFKKDFF
jgi:hypothetical protein